MASRSSIAREIAIRHFGQKMVTNLEKKGCFFHGVQATPAWDGDTVNSGSAYQVVINDTLCVRSYWQIQAMAKSTWTAQSMSEVG
jgi:hypothetical protein